MTKRLTITSGAQWEDVVGYSRATKIGNTIEVSGTVSIKDGKTVAIGDAYGQTKRILEIIDEALRQTGSGLGDVIRTRIYVTDIRNWEQVGKAHGEVFASIKPATSMVEVNKLISPEFLVEIEATAILP